MIPSFLKPGVKRVYYGAKLLLGFDRRGLGRIRNEGLLTILNLHRVSPDGSRAWPPLVPRLFDELLGYLAANFRVLTFSELNDTGAGDSGRPPLILSFDDGFVDFLDHAMPLLRKHHLRANMNVIPKFAEEGGLPWNIRLYDFLDRAPASLVRELELPVFSGKRWATGTGAEREAAGIRISAFLKNRSHAEREAHWAAVDILLRRWGEGPALRMMTTAELKGVASEHELGAHSWSHESMGFEAMEFFQDDVARCQTWFREKLGRQMSIYAFPNGSFRREQVHHLLASGVEHVLLVDDSFSSPTARVHPRLTVTGDTLAELKVKSVYRPNGPARLSPEIYS